MRVAILGAGAFGVAIGDILLNNGHSVHYYDPKIKGCRLENIISGAGYIVLALPSEFVNDMLPLLPKDIPLIVATKGLLSDSYFSDFQNYIIISGPGFADDIKAKKKTHLTTTSEQAIKLLANDYLTFDVTSDKLGVLMCGALKNVYAILAGFWNLLPGTSEHGLFLADAVKEMKEILSANDADPRTVGLACGEQDLRITCGSPSRNYEFGQKLRTDLNYKPEKTIEGISTLKRIKQNEIIIPKDAKLLKELIAESLKWA